MIHTVGGERDGQQGDRRGTTTSEIASRAFDVVVAGLVLLVVWPVLADVVGCTDAIDDDATGLLVPPRDVGALVAALRRYADDPTLRRQHGRPARERVARMFRQEQIWEALHDEYQRLMRGKA
jgi:glycosyltransferase involved in cell wall biosynthesis